MNERDSRKMRRRELLSGLLDGRLDEHGEAELLAELSVDERFAREVVSLYRQGRLLETLVHLKKDNSFGARVLSAAKYVHEGGAFAEGVVSRIDARDTDGTPFPHGTARTKAHGRSGTRKRTMRWSRWLSIAACLAIVVGAHLLNLRQAKRMPEIMIAKLATMKDVVVERNGMQITVHAGMELFLGDVVRTGARGGARVEYEAEETSVDLLGDTEVKFRDEDGAKRIDIPRGTIECDVAPQPDGREMAIRTPHAVAFVKSTRFRLMVDKAFSRLEVYEGLVGLTNILDGRSVDVAAGHWVSLGAGIALAVKALGEPVAKVVAERKDGEPVVTETADVKAESDYVLGPVIFQDDFDNGLDNWEQAGIVARVDKEAVVSLARGKEKSPFKTVLGDGPLFGVTIKSARLRTKRSFSQDAFSVEVFATLGGRVECTPFPWARVIEEEYAARPGSGKLHMSSYIRWECVSAGRGDDGTPRMKVRAFARDGRWFSSGKPEYLYKTAYIACSDRRIGFGSTRASWCIYRVVVRELIRKGND